MRVQNIEGHDRGGNVQGMIFYVGTCFSILPETRRHSQV